MTTILSNREAGELSRSGLAAYERQQQRRKNFEKRRDLAKTLAIQHPEAQRQYEAVSRKFAQQKDAWEKAQADYEQARADFLKAQQESESAQRAAECGWLRNQLVLLTDDAITDGVTTLRELWDEQRNSTGGNSRVRQARQDAMERIQDGIAKVEALKFDADINAIEDLESRVLAIVEEYSR